MRKTWRIMVLVLIVALLVAGYRHVQTVSARYAGLAGSWYTLGPLQVAWYSQRLGAGEVGHVFHIAWISNRGN